MPKVTNSNKPNKPKCLSVSPALPSLEEVAAKQRIHRPESSIAKKTAAKTSAKKTAAKKPAAKKTLVPADYEPQPYVHVPKWDKDKQAWSKPTKYADQLLADVPNESTWRTDIKPKGLYNISNGISKDTAKKLWRFFHPHKAKSGETKPTDAMAAIAKMHDGPDAPKDGSGIKCDPDREPGSFPWVKRFTRYKTCHYNSAHFNVADVPEIQQAVIEAVEAAILKCKSPTLALMTDMAKLSVAIMRHAPNWGLGRHPDTWARDGFGLVIMITVANTNKKHRTFRYTCPPRGLKYDVETEHASVIVFTEDAYDTWEHESIRNPKQDGDCISLTVRLKMIDGYFSWDIPESLKKEIDLDGAGPKEHREVGFARMMQHQRLKRDRPWA